MSVKAKCISSFLALVAEKREKCAVKKERNEGSEQ